MIEQCFATTGECFGQIVSTSGIVHTVIKVNRLLKFETLIILQRLDNSKSHGFNKQLIGLNVTHEMRMCQF